MTVDGVVAAVFDSGAEDRSDAGDTNADEYLREISEHLGLEPSQLGAPRR